MDIMKDIKLKNYDNSPNDIIQAEVLYFVTNESSRDIVINKLGEYIANRYNAKKWSEIFNLQEYQKQTRNSFSVYHYDTQSGRLIKDWEQLITDDDFDLDKGVSYINNGSRLSDDLEYNEQPKRQIHKITSQNKSQYLLTKALQDVMTQSHTTLQDQIDNQNALNTQLQDELRRSYENYGNLSTQMGELGSKIRLEYDADMKALREKISQQEAENYTLRAEVKELNNKLETERWKNETERNFDTKIRKIQDDNSGSMLSDIIPLLGMAQQFMGNNTGGNQMPVNNTLTNNASSGNYRPAAPPPQRIVRRQPVQQQSEEMTENFENSEIEVL